MNEAKPAPARASMLFHLAFALGFVPLLGVVLAAIGLAAVKRDPSAVGWKRPLLAVLIFDAVVWPAVAYVWLLGEPLVLPAVSDEDSLASAFWEIWRPAILIACQVVLLVAMSVYLRVGSRRAALALRWVLIAILASMAAEVVPLLAFEGLIELARPVRLLLLKAPPSLVLLAMAVVAYLWMRRRFDASEEPAEHLSRGAGFGLGVLYLFAGLIRYIALAKTVKILFPPDLPAPDHIGDEPVTSALSMALALAPVTVILAPLGEELLFRGVLFPGLRSRVVLWKAYLVSALTFALMHDLAGINALLFLWLGLVLAWARHRTGGLLVPILLHAGYNLYVLFQRLIPL